MTAIWITIAGVFALWGIVKTAYWGYLATHVAKYHTTEFKLTDFRLSNPQRNVRRFWVLNGEIDGKAEDYFVARSASVQKGDVLRVEYNPRAPDMQLGGRTIRVIPREDLLQPNRELARACVFYYTPLLVLVIFLWCQRNTRKERA